MSMDIQDPMPVASAPPSADAVDPTDTGSRFWDWFLFGLTAFGAAIVYIALFMKSAMGFVVGEAICLTVGLIGIALKCRHKRRLAENARRSI